MQIVWFKRDLRVHDNEALFRAAAAGPVLPLYVAEPDLWQQPDMAARHWGFICESLHELNEALAGLGQPLVLRTGDVIGFNASTISYDADQLDGNAFAGVVVSNSGGGVFNTAGLAAGTSTLATGSVPQLRTVAW